MPRALRGRFEPLDHFVTREYLTTAEIERLMAAARKSSRYGHRDATMILIGYRHCGRPSCAICNGRRWSWPLVVYTSAGRRTARRVPTQCRATRYTRCGVCSANRGRPRTSSMLRYLLVDQAVPAMWRSLAGARLSAD